MFDSINGNVAAMDRLEFQQIQGLITRTKCSDLFERMIIRVHVPTIHKFYFNTFAYVEYIRKHNKHNRFASIKMYGPSFLKSMPAS